jgi:hypothetical protein
MLPQGFGDKSTRMRSPTRNVKGYPLNLDVLGAPSYETHRADASVPDGTLHTNPQKRGFLGVVSRRKGWSATLIGGSISGGH